MRPSKACSDPTSVLASHVTVECIIPHTGTRIIKVGSGQPGRDELSKKAIVDDGSSGRGEESKLLALDVILLSIRSFRS